MRDVAIAVTDGMLHFELGIALEVFGSPPPGISADAWYNVRLCGSAALRVGRFSLEPDSGWDRLKEATTVIVPGWADIDAPPPADLVEAVSAAHHAGAQVASLCTGAFVLAAAGLLDDRPATTHWAHTDALTRRYPRVRVDPDVLYVDGGDVLTSAGKAAAMDLCLHLVRLHQGSAVANAVARRLVTHPHRPGGQAQFITTPVPYRDEHSIAPLLSWVLEHLNQPLTVEDVARRAGVTSRTLSRHFVAATGSTPSRWIHAQRIRHAQELLETTNASIESIAALTGLGTGATLRRHFKHTIGVPPEHYRRTFRREGDASRSGE